MLSCSVVSNFVRPHGSLYCYLLLITIANYKMIIIQFLAIDDLGISWVTIFHDERLYPEFPAQCNQKGASQVVPVQESWETWVQSLSLEGAHGNPLQCFCLEKSMDRGAWWATVHGVAKSQTWLKPLSTHMYQKKDDPIWESNRASVG